jgi:hypothetical protein
MTSRSATSSSRAARGERPTSSVPARPDAGENSSSTLIEAPQKRKRGPLDPHDFADGGGGGGAEAFSRRRTKPAGRA